MRKRVTSVQRNLFVKKELLPLRLPLRIRRKRNELDAKVVSGRVLPSAIPHGRPPPAA
jgi:hypothetical protein